MKHAVYKTVQQAGFTLIELLLYISIVGALLMSAVSFAAMSTNARVKNQTISEVDQQGIAVMEYISQTVRNADTITTPAAGATGASLTVTVPTASVSPTIFNLAGSVLQVKEGAATAVPLTNSKIVVSNLVIKNLSRSGTPGNVQISFTVSRDNPSNRNEFSYEKTFTTAVSIRP